MIIIIIIIVIITIYHYYYYYYYYYYDYYYVVVVVVVVIELKHSQTILENTAEIEPQPVTSDFKNLSQYSSRSK